MRRDISEYLIMGILGSGIVGPPAIIGFYGYAAIQDYYPGSQQAVELEPVQFQAQDIDNIAGLDTLIIDGKEFEISRSNNKLSLLEK